MFKKPFVVNIKNQNILIVNVDYQVNLNELKLEILFECYNKLSSFHSLNFQKVIEVNKF